MPFFERLTPERPPASQEAALIFEPKRERLLLVIESADHDDTDVWALESAGWVRVAKILPNPSEDLRNAGAPVAWIDRASGEAVIGRFAGDGLRTIRLSAPDVVTHYAHDLGTHVHLPETHAVFHPARGAPVLLLCKPSDAEVFVIEDGALVSLGKAPYLHAFAMVEDASVAVGYDVHGTLFAFDGQSFEEVADARGLEGLAWYPPLETLVSLCAASDGRMVLSAWTEKGFVAIEPEISALTNRNGGRLAVTPDLRVVYFGGQDFDRGGSLTNATLVSAPGGNVLRSDDEADAPIGRYTTLITTPSHLVLADHSSMKVVTPAGERGWKEIAERLVRPCEPSLDDRYVSFAASGDRVFLLDTNGALWAAETGGAFAVVASAEPGPGGHYSHRVALAWDPPSRSVVVFGGVDRNSTWVVRDREPGFVELRPHGPPPHGIGAMVSTPRGVYLLVEGELHHFEKDEWECVAKDLPGASLFYDPKRDALLVGGRDPATPRGPEAFFAIDANGAPHVALELPTGARFGSTMSPGAVVGLDPEHDRLLVFGKRDAWTFSLSDLQVPLGGLPTHPIPKPTQRHANAPKAWTAPAARIRKGHATSASRLDVTGNLIAFLPTHADALPLPVGIAGIAISEDPDGHGDGEGWKIGGGGGYHARLVKSAELADPTVGFIVEAHDTFALVIEPLTEIDPAHTLEVDTPPGRADAYAFGTKLGGYPRFIQDDPTEDYDGPPLRFAAQVGSDLISVGDVGKLYVWLTDEPSPRAYVVMQSH